MYKKLHLFYVGGGASCTPSPPVSRKRRARQRGFAHASKHRGATSTGNIYCKSQTFKGKIVQERAILETMVGQHLE